MKTLEAALAFSITMLFLAMIVSTIVETAHRIFGLREAGLKLMLQQMYEDNIRPRLVSVIAGVTEGAGKGPQEKAGIGEDFVEVMTRNRAPPPKRVLSLTRLTRPTRLSALSTMQFIQRLADTQVGQGLAAASGTVGGKTLNSTLIDLARRYEELGANASEYFARRAKLVSVIVALGIAFALNVDALGLFRAYLSDEELTASIIAQSEDIRREFQTQAAALERTMDELSPTRTSEPDAGTSGEKSETAESPAETSVTGSGTSEAAADASVRELKQASAALVEKIDDISEHGFPIGWEYFPYCAHGSTRGLCDDVQPGMGYLGQVLVWLLGVLLGGLLIGLGGPFWFDVIRKLTRALNVGRSGAEAQQARDEADRKRASNGVQPTSVLDAFETAIGPSGAGRRH